MEYGFNAEEWIKLSPSERTHRCRLMAAEARKLAQNASATLHAGYAKLSDNWDQLASDIERNGGTKL